MKNFARTKFERGAALITTLAIVAIVSLLMSGICLLATSHVDRRRTDSDYAMAMQAAEAGLNYEMNYMSANLATCPTTSQSVPGGKGSFTVTATNPDGTAWTSPNSSIISATGTVGPISRTVQIAASFATLPIFAANPVPNVQLGTTYTSDYGVFGVQTVTMAGSANCLYGNVGTNGTISLQGDAETKGTGVCVACGSAASISGGGNLPATRRKTTPLPMNYPTVQQLVNQKISGGFVTLSSAASLTAQAGRIRKFVGTSNSVLSPSNTTLAGWPTSGSGATSLGHTFVSGLPQATIILTPGDYYLTNLNLQTQDNIIADTQNLSTGGAPGQVNIWMSGNTQADSLAASSDGYSFDPTMFRIYYGKAATITVTADTHIQGGIYAVDIGSGTGTGATVALSGNSNFWYAVIADNVTLWSGVQVSLITQTGEGGVSNDSTDPQIQSASGVNMAFKGSWQELLAPGAGKVFADGTNN